MGHPELEALLRDLLKVVRGSLRQSGMFPPFGVLGTGGGPSFVAANFYEFTGAALVERVRDGLRRAAAAADVRTVGLVHDSRIDGPLRPDRAGAFCVALEHRDGPAMVASVTWRKGWFGRVKLRVSETRPGAHQYFERGGETP